MYRFGLIIFAGFILYGCKADMATDNLAANETDINLFNEATAYQALIEQRGDEISDAFLIDTAYIIGDWLNLRVSYSGGCDQHSFNVYWSNSWIYTDPPQTTILITHNANGDLCEAWITQDLSVNLAWLMNETNTAEMKLLLQNGSNTQDFIVE